MSTINILCVGDVVGENGCEFIKNCLWEIRTTHKVDLAIVNGENSAKTNGVDRASADLIFSAGADVITTGNHVWKRSEIYSYIDNCSELLRPANYPSSCPGQGYTIKNIDGYKVLIISLMGQVYMEPLGCPFETVDKILAHEKNNYDFSVCDFHAEATSEKLAFANYFDGRINVIFGTHTHVQTADLQILKGGTGYITDIGMTGPIDSILGIKTEIIVEKFLNKMPIRFEISQNPCALSAALFTLDTDQKRIITAKIIKQLPKTR